MALLLSPLPSDLFIFNLLPPHLLIDGVFYNILICGSTYKITGVKGYPYMLTSTMHLFYHILVYYILVTYYKLI